MNRSLVVPSAAPPLLTRLMVNLAPSQFPLDEFSAPSSASVTVRAVPASRGTYWPAPAQATLSPSRLAITGVALLPDTTMPLPVWSAIVTAESAPRAQSSAAARL